MLEKYILDSREANQEVDEDYFGHGEALKHVKIDWHDYKLIEYEKHRKGPGENGASVILENVADIELNKKLHVDNGFSAVISDKISFNRSVPDIRHKE